MKTKLAVMLMVGVVAGLSPHAMGDFYGVSWSRGRMVQINETTLVGKDVANFATTAEHANAMTMDLTGRLIVNNETEGRSDLLVTFDPLTNQYLPGPVQTDVGDIRSLAMSPAGVLYASTPNRLYTINTTTGHGTLLNAQFQGVQGLTFMPDGTLYGATTNALYRLNPLTGAQQLIGVMGIQVSGMQTILAGPGGQLLGAFQQPFGVTNLYSINTATGAATWLAAMQNPTNSSDIRGMELVPAPGVPAILAMGLLAAARRRRSRHALA